MNTHRFTRILSSLLPLLIATVFGTPANAGGVVGAGTPASCNPVAFHAALGGGGDVTFNCGGSGATIVLSATENITSNTRINGGGKIVLSGANVTSHFKVHFGSMLELQDIVLLEGMAPFGGAIENNGTTLALGVTFASNTALDRGGAIFNRGELLVRNSRFTRNVAAVAGGAIADNNGRLDVVDSKFEKNRTTAFESFGGAIANWGNLTILNSAFFDNSSRSGGALFNVSNAALVQLSLFSGNESRGGGGAIENLRDLTVEQSTLIGNQASSGGGISHSGGSLRVISSTLSGNRAHRSGGFGGYGGGISAWGQALYLNSTLSGNQADDWGGGLFQGAGPAVMIFTTVANNLATKGAGVYKDAIVGALSLQNTLLSKNSTGDCGGMLTSLGHNLSSDATCSAFTQPGDQMGVDPKLGPLVSNGGPTMTHLPQPGSPAIDAAVVLVPFTADQRGIARPQGAQTDIGSVEVP